ncbi:TonB-dependent receptor [Enhygromyxa salina]|uniref:TonB-dependent receptor n=1 Tax=Enhygromyxa salina TaxID=215803 RepID=A0A0C2D5P4_9BACT|nr:TonB-dependent receptor [Enhygromyxa salina]KIG15372.1 TonB-dependent receptor [Enhygromyxa salina]
MSLFGWYLLGLTLHAPASDSTAPDASVIDDDDHDDDHDDVGDDEPPGRAEGPTRRARRPPRGEAPVAAQTIIVSTGTRTAHDASTAPVATTLVTRQDIVDSGAETLAEALEHQDSSISLTEGVGGTELSLRGFDPEQVLVLIDGQRATGRIDGTIDLSRFTVENVERVEIVHGAGSVVYGSDAVGGVINIITRDPDPGVQSDARVVYASRNTVDASGRVAGGMRRWQLAGFGGYHRTDGWDATPFDEATTGDRVDQWNVGAGAKLQLPSEVRMSLDGNVQQRLSQGVDRADDGSLVDRANSTYTGDLTYAATWVGDSSQLRGTAHYNVFKDLFVQDQREGEAFDQRQPTWDHIGQFSVQLDQLAGRHLVTSGADVQLEWLVSERVVAESGANRSDRQRVALFMQDEWTPTTSPRVTVLPALRVDYDSRFGLYPTGRLALLVAPIESLTLRAAYGRGYRAPSFREMHLAFVNAGVGYRVTGNPSLAPEQAWTGDLGLTWTPSKNYRVELGLFDNQLRDLITVDVVANANELGLDTFSYVNVGSAFVRGVEASGFVGFLRHFEAEAGYTFLHARNKLTRQPLPGRAAHQATLALRFHQRSWGTRAVVRGRVTGRRAFSVSPDLPVSFAVPFASIDVRVSQSFLRYFGAFVGVENLLDAGDATTNPIAPRSFYGGLSFRY